MRLSKTAKGMLGNLVAATAIKIVKQAKRLGEEH